MGTIRDIFCAFGLCVASSVDAHPIDRWAPDIAEASGRFGVPTDWIRRVMMLESGGQTTRGGRPLRSRAGAIGLMQLMPKTWAAMRDTFDFGTDPDDPRSNILAGTAYLRLMYDRFGYPGLFAAYNAGPGRYVSALERQGVLPTETRTYLARLVGRAGSPDVMPTRVPDVLFAVRTRPPGAPAPAVPQRPFLFAIVRSEDPRP